MKRMPRKMEFYSREDGGNEHWHLSCFHKPWDGGTYWSIEASMDMSAVCFGHSQSIKKLMKMRDWFSSAIEWAESIKDPAPYRDYWG